MADYAAFVAAWGATSLPSGVQGTLPSGLTSPAEKLTALNAWTVAGPRSNVRVSAVVGKLMLSGAYLTLYSFSQGNTSGVPLRDQALLSAKMLMAMISTPNAPDFEMSDLTTYAAVKGMLDALLALEVTSAGTTGVTQDVYDTLLGLAETRIPWWMANGYPSSFIGQDAVDAGVV